MKINCGENIRKYRFWLFWNLLRFCRISSWENNRTEPNLGQIEKMCIIFGCKKTDLIEVQRDIPDYVPGTVEIIDLYSRATPEQRQAVLNLLRSFVQE